MLHLIGRLSFIIASGFALLIILSTGIGKVQQRDVFVYAASVDNDPRVTNVSLYDLQSGLSVALFQRVDLLSIDVSSDGRFLLMEQRLRRERELQIFNFASQETLAIYQGEFDMARLSPDNQWVAYRRTSLFDNGIYRMSVEGGEPQQIAPLQSIYALSADNRAIYYSGWGTKEKPGILRRDIESGVVTSLLAQELLFITDMTTYGHRIAFMGNRAPHIFDIATAEAQQLHHEMGVGASVAWSLDGQRIAVVTGATNYTQTSSLATVETEGVIILDLAGEVVAAFSPPQQNYNYRIGWVNLR